MPIIPVLLLAASLFSSAAARLDGPRPGVDVLRYEFHVVLSDESNTIDGKARVTLRFEDRPRDFYLDLVSSRPGDGGMTVSEVALNDAPVAFEHREDRLWIHLGADFADSLATVRISYRGVPADGLIISQNRYGDRVFFADNWPNRARHWMPTVDHPADKAFVDFIITAPAQYQVVGNGTLVEETDISPGVRLTHWSSTTVLPTKVMAIGVARFAVQNLGFVDGVPVQTWVYPQAREYGFYDFAVAEQALRYFLEVLGPFPFSKLANVQSTTRYGGMENASAIFYDENSVTGIRQQEDWVAHEISHQWFGNSATEEDWNHIWLSEGFATYFAHLYFEHYYGSARLATRMEIDRQAIIRYAAANPTSSIVEKTDIDPNRLLTVNSYEKGGWTLHMLRALLGDDIFWKSLNEYYHTYQFGNATTEEFRDVVESVSGQDLDWFFDQWIYRPGVPVLQIAARYDQESKETVLDIEQQQPQPYRLTLELDVEMGSESVSHSFELTGKRETFRIAVPEAPTTVRFDPDVKLLARIEVR